MTLSGPSCGEGKIIVSIVGIRAISSITPFSAAPSRQQSWFATVYVGNSNKNPKKTYKDAASSCFDKLRHYSGYLARHDEINVVCRQPLCYRRNQNKPRNMHTSPQSND